MIKHEFNNISNWVAIQAIMKKEYKYSFNLSLNKEILNNNDNNISDNNNDFSFLDNFYIKNTRNEYLKSVYFNDIINFNSSYYNDFGNKNYFLQLKKENILFAFNCLHIFLETIKKEYNDFIYVWSFEISDVLKFNFLIGNISLDYSDLQSFLKRIWVKISKIDISFDLNFEKILDLNSVINCLFRLPLKIGYDLSTKQFVSLLRLKFEYKFSYDLFKFVSAKIIEFDKVQIIKNLFNFQLKANTKDIQKELELIYLEKSLKYQSNNKHFFNYFGRLLKSGLYNDFIEYISDLIKNRLKKKDIINHFIISRVISDESLKTLNKTFIYKFLISIFTLFYVHSVNKIKRNKLSFYSQIGKIYYYGHAKKVHDIIFEQLKLLYPNFDSKQTYELLYKNTGLYFITFLSLREYIKIIELADNMIEIDFMSEDILNEFKINKKKIYSQNFPLISEPKHWDLNIKNLNINCSGGLIQNGVNFNIPLGKGNRKNLYTNTGNVIKTINYLQSIPYEIDCMFLDYLNVNLNIIKQNVILLNIDENFDIDVVKIQKQKSFDSKKEVFDRIMNVLNVYKFYKYFYFVYQIDFRGRIYIVSDFLNYQTNKISRSILKYWKKQKISKNDDVVQWLKVITVRKFLGSNKESFVWYVDYFNNNLEKLIIEWIYDRNSFNEFFWLKADEPYHFLSLLFEWFRYYSSDEYFYSGFIMFFDATCSGSQLISLLFGVDKYAKALNLNSATKFDKIQDYYIFVVHEFMNYCNIQHSKKGFFCILNNYDDFILRKLFKKVIMTINYGLTKKGMKFKFKEQLIDLNKLVEWSDYNLKIFVDIFYNFIENLAIVKPLNIVFDYISFLIKNNKDFVMYTSFKGFVIDEKFSDLSINLNYNKKENYKYSYSLSKKNKRKRKQLSLVFFINKRDKLKEIRAFKANYIHHIDSIVVYSSILNSFNDNIELSVIHDCFGIKLLDINNFNKIYRNVLIDFFNENNSFLNWLEYIFKRDISDKNLLNKLLKELDLLKKNYNNSILKNIENSFYIIFP